MTIICKNAEDFKVAPKFADYEQTRATFEWPAAQDPCAIGRV